MPRKKRKDLKQGDDVGSMHSFFFFFFVSQNNTTREYIQTKKILNEI